MEDYSINNIIQSPNKNSMVIKIDENLDYSNQIEDGDIQYDDAASDGAANEN